MDEGSTVLWVNKAFENWYGNSFVGNKMIDLSSYPDIKNVFNICLKKGQAYYRNAGKRNGKYNVSAVTLSKFKSNARDKILWVGSNITEVVHTYEIIAHDMKAPLTLARISVYTLIKTLKVNKWEKQNLLDLAERIHAGIISCENFARSLEVWGKYQSGTQVSDKSEILFSDFFNNLLKDFESSFHQNNIQPKINNHEQLSIYADRRNLEAVFRNLISNAIKSMDETEIKELEISYKLKGSLIEVNIKDTGVGMNEEVRKNLFEDSIAYKGLGSYISKKFVEDIGGNIYVKSSKPNLGSIITIEIPKY